VVEEIVKISLPQRVWLFVIGAMAILAKMDYEVSPKPPSAELLVRTRLQQIKTKG